MPNKMESLALHCTQKQGLSQSQISLYHDHLARTKTKHVKFLFLRGNGGGRVLV